LNAGTPQKSYDEKVKLSLSKEQSEFRDQVVDFLDTYWREQKTLSPSSLGSSGLSGISSEAINRWYQRVFDQGWALIDWPENLGGPGWDPIQKYIWISECGRRCIPLPSNLPGVAAVGPLLFALGGNHRNIDQFLEGITNNDSSWGLGPLDQGWNQRGLSLVRSREGFSLSGREVVCGTSLGCDWALVFCRETQDEYVVLVEIADRLIERMSGEVGALSTSFYEVEFDDEKISEDQMFLVAKGPRRKKIMELIWEHDAFYQSPLFLQREIARLMDFARKKKMDRGLIKRLVELGIELKSLEACEMHAIYGQDQKIGSRLSLAQLNLRTLDLTARVLEIEVDLLAYYSVPSEDRLTTHNERSLGPDGAEYAIKKLLYINAWIEGVTSLDRAKGYLASRLEMTEDDEI
jgi:hypothetical protein